ncbi:hypothetical protein ACFLTL_00600 [Chloroflexota bacterium]
MKGARLIALVASIALVLVLVLSSCGDASTPTSSPTSTPTPTQTPPPTSGPTPTPQVIEVEKEYRALNPSGAFIPVETQALSPRLDSFNGKTIYVIQGEADPVIMPALAAALPVEFPNATFVYYNPSSSFGATSADDTVVAEADGVIRGIGW